MDLDARHLRVLCTIAAAGSLTKAAAQLCVSQPALTNQLRRIEQLLGGPLFIRTRHGTTATILGEFVVARALPALGVIERIREDAVDLRSFTGDQSSLRYVANPGPLMVGLVGCLDKLWPGDGVTLCTEADVVTAAKLVADGQQDLAAVVTHVWSGASALHGLEHLLVAEEPAFVLLGDGHPAVNENTVTLADLSDEYWALPASRGSGRIQAFADAGFTARIRHEVEASAARELVAAGYAVGLGQATFRATPNIVPIPLLHRALRIQHLLLWRPGNPIAKAIPTIALQAREIYQRAVASSPHYLAHLARFGADAAIHTPHYGS